MGSVYKARDPLIDRVVAVKTILSGQALNATARARFLREARAAGQLSHPNIITIFELGAEEGRIYLVMEYLEGEDLKDIIAQGHEMTLLRKLEIVIAVCEALAYAHSRGVIHRDVKPANIFLTHTGRVKNLDYSVGTDLSVNQRLSLALDFLRVRVFDSPRLVAITTTIEGLSFPGIRYQLGDFDLFERIDRPEAHHLRPTC
jgi:serine/threonine protein kinase